MLPQRLLLGRRICVFHHALRALFSDRQRAVFVRLVTGWGAQVDHFMVVEERPWLCTKEAERCEVDILHGGRAEFQLCLASCGQSVIVQIDVAFGDPIDLPSAFIHLFRDVGFVLDVLYEPLFQLQCSGRHRAAESHIH